MSGPNATFRESNVDLYKIESVTLSVMSAAEVNAMSVSKIYDINTYNANGEPVPYGINDDRMGTMDRDRHCKTCMGTQVDCPGHFGHIKLEKPVYHGNLLDYIRKVLKAVCFNCSHLLADNEDKEKELQEYCQIKSSKSRFNKVQKLSSGINICKNCQMKNRKYSRGNLKIDYEIQDDQELRPNNDTKQVLWPEDCKAIFSKITPKHLEMLGLSKSNSDPANMIIENLTVVPPPVRPSVQMIGCSSRSEDDLTVAYKQIIKQNKEIERAIKNGNTETTINDLRYVLQFYCATLMDNKISGVGTQKHKSGQPLKAIRERLKGKEGRLRGNLMGKRCDFTARSVITCDPNLQLDQLGVPKEIAMNMTVPEVVTPQNIEYLRNLVIMGATKWPGAKFIKRLDGKLIDLEQLPNRTDQHLEPGYVVERHLQNNDYVIFNRQPSLHKMSMMGHRIKVLDYQTFRLNLSVTTPYNADFDGDEMNMHVPQSLETKAEIKEIMSVPRQILAPQKNAPCMGIVQDALLGINRLTGRDTFVEKHVLMNILMFVDYDLQKGLPQPAIIKPKPLWSGKQVISLVIPKVVNLDSSSNFDDFKKGQKSDSAVCVQSGELLAGVMRKGTVGSSAGGLIHITWKDLGPQACSDLLSNIQFVVNNWLVNTGFTVGVQDIIAKPAIINRVKETIIAHKQEVRDIVKRAQGGTLKQQPGKSMIESFEAYVNKELNNARDKSGQIALQALASDNRLKNMVNAGSKGSEMNISQIMACVGQQNVEGQRIKFGFNRRTLPHFPKDDFGPESKGFVENSYLTGLTPSEFYFHAMGGREGLIDTAVKTANTGYISRRLIKSLEDVMVKYDGTVRTSREVLIQFLYGEDGMAGEHFETISLPLAKYSNDQIAQNCDFLHNIETEQAQRKLTQCIGSERVMQVLSNRELRQLFAKEFEQLKQDRETLRHEIMIQGVTDKVIMPVNLHRLIVNVKALNCISSNQVTDLEPLYYFQQVKQLLEQINVMPECKEPSKIHSEAMYNSTILFKICLRYYLCSKQVFVVHRLDKLAFDQLLTNIRETYRSAIVHPGEMVGSIAANSIGEPATQMTLNTFHNAGISSKNVTLGVPRLQEVINVAKTLKTPYMKIFLDPAISKDELQANRIGSMIQYQNLSHIVSEWGIYFDPDPKTTIIEADTELLELIQMAGLANSNQQEDQNICKWVLRFAISTDPFKVKFDDFFQFRRDVGAKIDNMLNKEYKICEVIYSDENMTQKVIRIRPIFPQADTDIEIIAFLREMAEGILKNYTLRGIQEITKISTTLTVNECNREVFVPETGEVKIDKGNWVIESDGVALQQVMAVEGVDFTRTVSNSIVEIFQVLGIEATRLALISELKMILDTYSIYVNSRHITTLVDMMTLRGIITSITRHGINRVDVGPLRKCSFEETTEILLEAAFFGEHDPLSGISENIIFGQMAPYGTGSFELIVDRHALMNCIGNNIGIGMLNGGASDVYTPINDDGNWTPQIVDKTPDPYRTQNMGATSIYTPNPEGQMTPIYQTGIGQQSPMYPISSSPSYQGAYRPAAQKATGGYGVTPYGSTPVYGYSQTPNYVGYGDQGSAVYSPSGAMMGGASHHSSYSPTNMNPHQTPQYSPTTPNYHAGMTPIQHSTPNYIYGAGSSSHAYNVMPQLSSPSMNPASHSPNISNMGQGSGIAGSYGNSSPAIGGIYSSGGSSGPYSHQTPAYQNAISPNIQRLIGSVAPAYNPEAAGNQDSSDSDN